MVFVVGATAAAQVSLNAWNGPFYEAIAQKNTATFLHGFLVFAVIASGLLVLSNRQPAEIGGPALGRGSGASEKLNLPRGL